MKYGSIPGTLSTENVWHNNHMSSHLTWVVHRSIGDVKVCSWTLEKPLNVICNHHQQMQTSI
jgi:hypothetical protein